MANNNKIYLNIIIFFLLFFTYSIFAMELTAKQKNIFPYLFIESFFNLIFPQAKIALENLNKYHLMPIIEEKIKNNTLFLTALAITLLPAEIEYRILIEDVDPTKKELNIFNNIPIKNIIIPNTIPYRLNRKEHTYTIPKVGQRGSNQLFFKDIPENIQKDLIKYFRYAFDDTPQNIQILETLNLATLENINQIYYAYVQHDIDTKTFRYDNKSIFYLPKNEYVFLLDLYKKNQPVFTLFFDSEKEAIFPLWPSNLIKNYFFSINYQPLVWNNLFFDFPITITILQTILALVCGARISLLISTKSIIYLPIAIVTSFIIFITIETLSIIESEDRYKKDNLAGLIKWPVKNIIIYPKETSITERLFLFYQNLWDNKNEY